MRIRSILLILPLVWISQGCYKDNSNKSIDQVNPIVIDMGDAPESFLAYEFDSLKVQPVIYKVGVPDAQLSYKWELAKTGNLNAKQLLSEKMELKTVVSAKSDATPYILTLTVTEDATGLKNFRQFALTVNPSLGKGLLIADTDDGVTSDLNLVMSREFTQVTQTFDDKNTKVARDIFSSFNGAPIEGLVRSMVTNYHQRANDPPNWRMLTVMTDRHVFCMDPYEYLVQLTDNELFMIPSAIPDEINPISVAALDGPIYNHMIIDGKLYIANLQFGSYQYMMDMLMSDGSPYYLTMGTNFMAGAGYGNMCYFDELNNRFLQCTGVSSADLQTMKEPYRQGEFDLNDLGEDFKAIYMGSGVQVMVQPPDTPWGPAYPNSPPTIGAVLESEVTGKRYLFTFVPGSSGANDQYWPIRKYDLGQTPGFSNSIAWEWSPSEEGIMYYATEDKVYSLLLTTSVSSPTECFTPEPGEKITGMMLWRLTGQGRMYTKSAPGSDEERTLVSSGNQMMVIATYNEGTGEGKVTCVPIMYRGSGTFEQDKDFHVVFDGFGRIVFLAHQSI